jgi:16S rRNA (uracil1498-N3)-methyltransferase
LKIRAWVPGALADDHFELGGEEFHHAVRVARARAGEEIECFNGEGRNIIARIVRIDKESALLQKVGDAPLRDPALKLTVALALIQPEKFELVLQKGTELGVHRFVPLTTEHAEVRPERVAGKKDRWRKILIEATKQSGRAIFPRLEEPMGLPAVLEKESPAFFYEESRPPSPWTEKVVEATILIGPEGGWSEREIAAAHDAGVIFRRLGPRRLRAETAAIAAATEIGLRYGDLVPAE